MANSNNNNTTVQWSASGSVSLNSAAAVPSDAISISADAMAASIQVKADNAGTPAAGDVVNLSVVWAVNTTDYDTTEHAEPLGQLNTYGSDNPGEDPAAKTFQLIPNGKQRLKLVAIAPNGASRAITLTAIYNEHRSS